MTHDEIDEALYSKTFAELLEIIEEGSLKNELLGFIHEIYSNKELEEVLR